MSLFGSNEITKDVVKFIHNGDLSRCRTYVYDRKSWLNVIKDIYSNSLLHLSVKSKRPEIVKYLLSQNIDTKMLNIFGESAYDIAVKNHDKIILRIFEEELVRAKDNQIKENQETIGIMLNDQIRLNRDLEEANHDRKRLRTTNDDLETKTKKLRKDVTNYQDMLKKK